MNYFPPFEVVRRSVDIQAVRGDLRVNISYEDFVKLLKLMISGIEVDEDWYARALLGRWGRRSDLHARASGCSG